MKTILTFFAILSCQISFAQQSPYEGKFTEIDTLELRGQVASALNIANEIREASRPNSGNDYIKASMLRWKYLKKTTEDAENTIIQELNASLEISSGIHKAILYSVKGKLLADYFENQRYRGRQRLSGERKSQDIRTWSNSEILEEAVIAYELALQDTSLLLATPASRVDELLDTALITRIYKPTLFDIIAQEAMDFYDSSLYGVTRPDILFEIANEVIFKDSEAFRNWDFKSKDTLASKFNAVKLLQQIEEVHKDDTDVTAYVFAQLERMQFGKRYYNGGGVTKLYEEGLIALSRKHNNHPIHGLLQYAIASHYVDQAPKSYNKDADEKERSLYAKAKKICQEILKAYPNSEAAIRAAQLLKEINQLSLSIKTKDHTLPGLENRMFVSYRNLDSLRLRVLKLPADRTIENSYNLPQKTWEKLTAEASRDIVLDTLYVLPKAGDANYHTVELLIPALEHGYYTVFVSNNRLEGTQSYAFTHIEVSDFGYKRTDYAEKIVYQWYDRDTGQPAKDLKMYTTGGRTEYITNGFTDELGEYTINKARNNNSRNYRNNYIDITAIRKSDTLQFNDNIYPYYAGNDEQESRAKTELFLDRQIYRPGQTMYFKGILLKEVG